jgi:hypothetical protein
MRTAYVYTHSYNGEIIYIGKGTKKIMWNLKCRSDMYKVFLRKIGFENIWMIEDAPTFKLYGKNCKIPLKVQKVFESTSDDEALLYKAKLLEENLPRFNLVKPSLDKIPELSDTTSYGGQVERKVKNVYTNQWETITSHTEIIDSIKEL